MTDYWVKFDYNMRLEYYTGEQEYEKLELIQFNGQPITNFHIIYQEITQYPYTPEPGIYDWLINVGTPIAYSGGMKGYWHPEDPVTHEQFHYDESFVWYYEAKITDSFEVGTQPEPLIIDPPILTDTQHDDYDKYDVTVSWTDYAWAVVSGRDFANLFTKQNDIVNFNSLDSTQIQAVNGNVNLYDARGGGDVVQLPDTVQIPGTAKSWDPSQIFYGSGGRDEITGGKLKDHIDGGVGNDTVIGAGGDDWIKVGTDRITWMVANSYYD